MVHISVSEDYSSWFWLSCIGAILGCIVLSILLIHIIFHYRKIFYIEKESYHNYKPRVYYLMIAYLITSFIVCTIYCTVRSNIITFVPLETFRAWQCTYGYFFSFWLMSIARSFMWNLFNYRIQTAFAYTTYSYHRYCYKFLYFGMRFFCFPIRNIH